MAGPHGTADSDTDDNRSTATLERRLASRSQAAMDHPLKGRWWVRAMDGTRIEMGPGDILFGEDQGVRPLSDGPYKGKKGHDAGNVGDDEVTLLVIQSASPPEINKPCRYN